MLLSSFDSTLRCFTRQAIAGRGNMIRRVLVPLACLPFLTACVSSSVVRVSQDSAIVSVDADADCSSRSAASAAHMQAAIETIKAGYDRYAVIGSDAHDTVQVERLPGGYETKTRMVRGTYYTKTTYVPGRVVRSGSYEQTLRIKMFREGSRGSADTIPAREVLGPRWQELVSKGKIESCP